MGPGPIPELAKLQIALATRGYTPMDVTHYKASWVSGADQYPVPIWPRLMANGRLYTPSKPGVSAEARRPMVMEATFDRATPLRMRVNVVSSKATLVATADGNVFWQKTFVPGPGTGEWKQENFVKEWNTYQNVYDRDYKAIIPAGSKRVELAVTEGDWLTLSEIAVRTADGQEDLLVLRTEWDAPVAQLVYDAKNRKQPFVGPNMEDRQWLWETAILPWQQAQQQGLGVMVGEFGCHTRHLMTSRWPGWSIAWQTGSEPIGDGRYGTSVGHSEFSTANARMFNTRSTKGINSIGKCSTCCNDIEEPRTSQSRERISYKNDAEDLINPLPYLTLTTLGLSGMCSGLSQISR